MSNKYLYVLVYLTVFNNYCPMSQVPQVKEIAPQCLHHNIQGGARNVIPLIVHVTPFDVEYIYGFV